MSLHYSTLLAGKESLLGMEHASSSSSSNGGSCLQVVGAWTKAGVASCVHVKGPQLDLLFDCGINDSNIASADHVLISHGHLDHAGACVLHARGRALTHQPATYYVPAVIAEPMQQVKKAFETMDDREIPMHIKIVQPGDIIKIGSQYKIQVFETVHRVPSQGFAIYRCSKGKLLPEYSNKTPNELKELRLQGIDIISPPIETLDTVYTGDTIFEGLLKNPFVFQAPVLITECTYLDGAREKAGKWSHIHIEDIVEYADLFQNQILILVHLSQKYSCNRAIELLRLQLPESLIDRVLVSLHSFGAREMLTKVSDERWSRARGAVAGWGWTNSGSVDHQGPANNQQPPPQGHWNGGGRGSRGGYYRGGDGGRGRGGGRMAWSEHSERSVVYESNGGGRGGGRNAVFRESRTFRVQNNGPYRQNHSS